jgi:hypothetical protein
VLQPDDIWLETFSKLTEDFVMQNMNVSREKCYMDPEQGGLGLFRPNPFFKSLTCSWAKRCTTLEHDNWRRQLLNAGSDAGLELLQKQDVEQLGPILKNIAYNFIELRHDFGITHNFTYNLQGCIKTFDDNFFDTHLMGLEIARKRSLCWSEMVNGGTGNIKSINQINNSLGIRLDPVTQSHLSSAY